MKNLLFLALSLFLTSSFLPTKHNSAAISIHDLVASNQMEFIPQTNGGYNVESIAALIKNKGKAQRVLIPMGTRFTSVLGEEQDLIVPEDLFVDVPSNSEKKLTIDAYCMQHHNLSPNADQVFGFKQENSEDLMKILHFMKGKKYEPSIIQEAIWAITDGQSVAGISMNTPKEKELREFICATTGKENVWYDLDRNYTETPERQIIPETKKVSGNIAYEVTQKGNILLQVTEEDGTVIRELGGMPVNQTGNYNFNFSMEVQGWERGLYFVQLKLEDDVFHKVAFEV